MNTPLPTQEQSPLQVAMVTLSLAKRDKVDPDGSECILSPDEATAVFEHIEQLTHALEEAVAHNAALADLAKKSTDEAVAYVLANWRKFVPADEHGAEPK